MNVLPDAKAREFADILDEYEATIVIANLGKRDTMDDIRDAMRAAGLKGADLSDEMSRFRDAVKDRRLIQANPEKAERKERNRDGTVDYLFVLTEKASRTRERVKSAPVQAPHDAETGEVIDGDGDADVVGLAERLHRLAASGDTDALQVIAAAKYGPDVMRAVAAGILERDEHTNAAASGESDNIPGTDVAAPESCGGVEGDHALNRHAADRCDGTELAGLHPTIQFEGNGKACATGTRDDAHPETKPLAFRHEADEPGPQDTPTKPVRTSNTVAFIPDPSLPRVKNVGPIDDIPAFLKRANSGQVGRA